jgi:hypothetical protein
MHPVLRQHVTWKYIGIENTPLHRAAGGRVGLVHERMLCVRIQDSSGLETVDTVRVVERHLGFGMKNSFFTRT